MRDHEVPDPLRQGRPTPGHRGSAWSACWRAPAPGAESLRRVLDVRLDLHAPLIMLGDIARLTALHDETHRIVRDLGDPTRLARALWRVSSARWVTFWLGRAEAGL